MLKIAALAPTPTADRQDGQCQETRRAAERSRGIAEILEQRVDHWYLNASIGAMREARRAGT